MSSKEQQAELFMLEPNAPAHFMEHVRSRLGGKRSVSVADVAGTCNVSVTTVYSWIDAGLIEAVNVGTTRAYYRVHAPSVMAFLESRVVGGAK